jgi:putative ABC transport system permease protein
MKFAPLVLKHLRKNWIRTLSTVLAMSVCIFLVCVLQTVIAAVNFGLTAGSTRRLVTRDYVSLANNLPINYKQKIAAMPGVTDTTIVSWFGGVYRDPKNFFANLAVEPEAFLRIYPEIMLPADQKAAWLSDVRGAIVGRKLAERFGWKVGSTFQLESFIPPYRVGKPFDFVVDGIYDTDEARYPGTDLSSMYFNFKYLYEATGQRVGIGTLTVQIADPSQAGAISKEIDEAFENSDNQTKTETEQAFRAGFVALAGNLALLLNVIGMAVAFTILLVTANTMSIAVRERQQEIAVLKTLGFSSGLVMTLILSEALLLGLMGGLLGILVARGIISVLVNVPFLGDVLRAFPNLGLSPGIAALGVGLALALGLLAGFIPALMAYRSRITEALRQV